MKKTTVLLNWYATPYHTPVFVAKELGFFNEESLDIAILMPDNPSDVTVLMGDRQADFALKAMVHCYAARARGHMITSIGTLFDEPPTGLIFLKDSGIQEFADLEGKRIGFVGEFGKVIFDELAHRAQMPPESYEMVRVGMHAVDAIAQNKVDAAMGIACFQQVELEQRVGPASILRVDELAGLGCCCFCSVLMIAHEKLLQEDPERVHAFMRAMQRGMAYTLEHPDSAYRLMCDRNPQLRSEAYQKVFISCLPYFSRRLENVERDWNKVGQYSERLGVAKAVDPQEHYTNAFIPKPYTALTAIH